jgi:prepilin-type N-terminal cleavage/methylation domain-containing protein
VTNPKLGARFSISRPPIASHSAGRGFTLAEMAIVLLVVGILLAGLLTPLSAQIELRRTSETQKGMDVIKEAMLGYSASQTPSHLPCPDITTPIAGGTANDGQEDVDAAGVCLAQEGNVPWVTLGTAAADAWNNHFHYRVTTAFSNRTPATALSLAAAGDIRVCTASGCPTSIATTVPAVILSYGKNGFGAINLSGIANPLPASADEQENTNSNVTFVSRPQTNIDAAVGEFDDLVTWIPAGVIFNRLIVAQKLP